MVLDEDVILEIVRPGSGDPVAPGEVGEIVVTLFNADYPLIRFATGDLSAILPAAPASASGSTNSRTNMRIKGWLGRADQTTKVRAMFVHPSQVHQIAQRHPEIVKARLVVSGQMANDVMTLQCEVDHPPQAGNAAAIQESIRELTKLRGEVLFVARGSLPDDGKVIADLRDYK
jgi:phenylacetate-CoA ligase